MEKLSDLIKGRLGQHSLGAPAKSAEILFKANTYLTEYFGKNGGVKAYRLERGNLYIAAENATLSQELWGRRVGLLRQLKNSFGEKAVLTIRIKSLTIQ